MSLIYGIKTQIGVYLAADTRLKTTLSSGLIKLEDDFGKFHSFGPLMHLVAAGDANFASYLVQKIQTSDFSKSPYFEFKEKIQAFVEGEIGLYPNILKASNVVFIFAGCDPSRKERVNMDKLVEYTKKMQGSSGRSVQQSISGPVKEAMIKAAFEGRVGNILELDRPYVGLFSLEIIISNNGAKLTLTEVEWAEYLMYGPNGLTAHDAPQELVIDLDLGPKPKGISGQDLVIYDSLLLIEFFRLKMIPKHELHTVGGSVITFWITERGAVFPTGEVAQRKLNGSISRNLNNIFVHNGNISTKIGQEFRPLRDLIRFYGTGGQMDLYNI